MSPTVDAYLEIGPKRTFAGGIEWPGWLRSGRTEESALEALVDYGDRYAAAIGRAGGELKTPGRVANLRVLERLKGNASTDFGVPEAAPEADARPMDESELRRQVAILKAAWDTFSRTATKAEGVQLTKGPRGGGRELDAIVRHVFEGEQAYVYRLGGRYKEGDDDHEAATKTLRTQILELLPARVRGDPIDMGRRTAPLWTPRYFLRRTTWHVLDHAWEIHDRVPPTL
jgi:hypothetical protein